MTPIWIVSGTPGAGKSTTARALCARSAKAIHLPVDDLRELVVSGHASPIEEWTDETTRQFALARAAAAKVATLYAKAGYVAVIDDVAREADMPDYLAHLDRAPRKVLLSPRVEIAMKRNLTRTNKSFDTTRLAPHTERLHRLLLEGCPPEDGWTVIDSSDIDVSGVVDEILRRAG